MNRRAFIRGSLCAAGLLPARLPADESSSASAVNFSRRLVTAYDVDVFVAGGGPAGIAAALAARRNGASVFVAETSGAFGGAATAAYVPAFATFSDGVHGVVGGIGREIRGLVSKSVPQDAFWTPIDIEELKRTYDKLMSDSGIRFSFFTTVCDAIARNGRVERAVLSTKRGLLAVRAKVYIDTTGDGDLVAFAGGSFEKGDENGGLMPPTLCSQWVDIDFAKTKNEWPQAKIKKAIGDGVFSVPDPHLPGFFKAEEDKSSLGCGNIGHAFGVDATDERSLTRGMIDARRRMPEYERFFKEYLTGYERMRLASTAPFLGVRESRRICCDRMMTVEDYVNRANFSDEIGRYCYPIDIHASQSGSDEFEKIWKTLKESGYRKGESYGISFAALVPKSFENVLVAGRCMGADRPMQASLRVMPCCFITGQAAGTAAALATRCDGIVRSVRVGDLQSRLKAEGAYLPNFKDEVTLVNIKES